MRNIALLLTFDGTAYKGFQFQKNLPTIQGELNAAVSKVCNEKISVLGCGRTDAGVHARKYVASFRTNSAISPEKLKTALNSILAYDIIILKVIEASENFHAIASAKAKEYTYELYNTPLRNPFLLHRAYYFGYPEVDINLLKKGAEYFLGTHDFTSMRSIGTETKSTVRTIYELEVIPTEIGVNFRILANGFLYNMARAIVGTLLQVGISKISPEDIPKILEAKDRACAGPNVPAYGLYMTNIIYEEFNLDEK